MGEPVRRAATRVRWEARACLVPALFLVLAWCARAQAQNSTYREVYETLTAHDNRLPGSYGYAQSVDRVEATLRALGLEVHRQTFDTEVPQTQRARLLIDGQAVEPVYALAPNGIAPPSSWGGAIEGALVFVGEATPAELDGRALQGAIAVVDAHSADADAPFQHGAAAEILVGSAPLSQWVMAQHFTSFPVAMPRLFIERDTARRAGLLDDAPAAQRRGSLEVEVTWKRAEATNLWVKLGGRPPLTSPQAVIASAELGTFGAVPEKSPDPRAAANAALLAEVTARLAHREMARSFYAVFLGSHYAAEEASRYFYYAWQHAAVGNERSCPQATELYTPRAARATRKLALLDGGQFLRDKNDDAFEVVVMAQRALERRVGDLNYELMAIAHQSRASAQATSPRTADELAQRSAAAQAEKSRVNGWRGQLAARRFTDVEGERQLIETLRRDLQDELADDRRMSQHSRTWCALGAARVRGAAMETAVAHLGFDFADDQRPFMMSPYGAGAWSRNIAITGRTFARQAQALAELYPSARATTPQPLHGGAHLYDPGAGAPFRLDALATPHERSVASMPAVALGIAEFDLATVGARLDDDGMPFAAPASLEALAPQLTEWLAAIGEAPELPAATGVSPLDPVPLLVEEPHRGTDESLMVTDLAKGTDETAGPAHDALVVLAQWPLDAAAVEPPYRIGHVDMVIARPLHDGHVIMPGAGAIFNWDETARHLHAFGFDARGGIDRFTLAGSSGGSRAALHFGQAASLFTPFTPSDYDVATLVRWLLGSSDAEPRYHLNLGSTRVQVVLQDEPAPCKLLGNGTDLLGATLTNPTGAGTGCGPRDLLSLDPNRVAAHDADTLSFYRLTRLRSRHIIDHSLETLAADARAHLEAAAEARADHRNRLAMAHETAASVLGERVQRPLRDRTNDLVQAVVVLLLLSLPFSFAVERLLLGARSIYGQAAGFAAVFSLVFALLYFTHPAFSLAAAPMVVFLAFAIILLSALVIRVIMGKLKQELTLMQGLASTAHAAFTEGPSALTASAMAMAGMRNRPVKTWLSAVTVALLTFTVLVFTSFGSTLGVVATPLGAPQGAARIELHSPTWLPIPARLLDAINTLYGDRYDIAMRGASFADPRLQSADLPNVVWNASREKAQPLEGLLVLDPAEAVRWQEPWANTLAASPSDDPPPIALSKLVAQQVEAELGSIVQIRGQPFRVVALFDGASLKRLENLDGAPVVPPNFAATLTRLRAGRAETRAGSAFQSLPPSAFVWSAPDLTAITTKAGGLRLGAIDNMLTLYAKSTGALADDARDLAALFQGPVLASSSEGRARYFFTKAWGGTGFWDVFVPLLLGGLIIASSLLGSIVERQKEIFTWTALGLSPRDVGVLFLAEAAVLAVLGGMGGYLLSQLLTAALGAMSARGWVRAPELDFSSFASLGTLLLVMITVLLSSVYPAVLAGRSANPGVARRWHMPTPQGDKLQFTFPFTVSARDAGGIMAFIAEHFDSHRDASLGTFAARDVVLSRAPDAAAEGGVAEIAPPNRLEPALRAEVALAPFDLGVVQRFAMSTRPSGIEGIDEVVIELQRVNGAPNTWQRSNRAFVDDLRQQFLQWRALPVATMAQYHRRAEELFRC